MVFEPTVIASWVSIALNAFAARGVNVEEACSKANIAAEELKNPFTPVPLSKIITLWNYAESIIQRPTFGLESARFLNFTTFHSLGYAILASSSLYDAFVRIAAYSNAATGVGYSFLSEEPDRFIFGFNVSPNIEDVPVGCIDMTLAIFRFMCRVLHNERPKILCLEMTRETTHSEEIFHKLFSDNIILGSHRYALHFGRDYFLKPIPTANESVAKANDAFVEELISKINNQSITYRVRQKIVSHLNQEEIISIDAVAQWLNMSERNLQRSLKEEDTNFRALMDQERRKLAKFYLKESKCSISNIAYKLGFSDSANFSRAFRRWFNCKPVDYRQQL